MDADDRDLNQAEHAGRIDAARRLKALFPRAEFAARDDIGVMRLGWGRAVEHRPTSESTAEFALKADLVTISTVLRAQIFPLVSVHPEAKSKIGALYALADIVGAETMRDWSPLWEAMRRADYKAAASELMCCNWDQYYGSAPDKRRRIMELVLSIMDPPEALQ